MNALEVKEFRKRHGLNQEELAKIASVKVGTVQSWEQSKRKIGPSAIKLLQVYEASQKKSPPEEVRMEDLIAKRVLEELSPFIGQMTDRVIESVMDMAMTLDQIKSEQEDIKKNQEKTNDLIENKH